MARRGLGPAIERARRGRECPRHRPLLAELIRHPRVAIRVPAGGHDDLGGDGEISWKDFVLLRVPEGRLIAVVELDPEASFNISILNHGSSGVGHVLQAALPDQPANNGVGAEARAEASPGDAAAEIVAPDKADLGVEAGADQQMVERETVAVAFVLKKSAIARIAARQAWRCRTGPVEGVKGGAKLDYRGGGKLDH